MVDLEFVAVFGYCGITGCGLPLNFRYSVYLPNMMHCCVSSSSHRDFFFDTIIDGCHFLGSSRLVLVPLLEARDGGVLLA